MLFNIKDLNLLNPTNGLIRHYRHISCRYQKPTKMYLTFHHSAAKITVQMLRDCILNLFVCTIKAAEKSRCLLHVCAVFLLVTSGTESKAVTLSSRHLPVNSSASLFPFRKPPRCYLFRNVRASSMSR